MKLSGRGKRLVVIAVVAVIALSLLFFYPARKTDDRREPSAWGIAMELLSLWMSPTLPEEQTPPPATGEVRIVPYSRFDRMISAWHELTTFEPVVAIIRQDVNAQTGAISPDGQFIATGGSTLRDTAISSVAEKRIVKKFAIHHGNIWTVAFSPDGRYLATGRGFMANIPHNESVNIWDVQSGRLIRNLPGPAGPGTIKNDVTALSFSPDSRFLAVSYHPQPDRGDSIYLFAVESGEQVRTMKLSGPAYGQIIFFDGGKRLGCMGYSFEFDVFDVETGERVQNINEPALYALSPDGKFLAKATSRDQTLRIIERITGREVRVLGTAKEVRLLAYSPGGGYLAEWGLDGLRIWDATAGNVVATLTAQPDHVSHWIGFDPGGKYFAAVCGWYVVVWEFQKLTSARKANWGG